MNLDLNGPAAEFLFPDPDPRPPFPPETIPLRPPRIPELEQIRFPIRYSPARVKVLIVADGGCSYDTGNNFGLGVMLRDAFNVGAPPGTPLPPDYPSYARFEFILAHRATAAGVTPGFENFTFSDAKLAGFSQVWLFGVSTARPYIDGPELAALTKFMNDGGGVFATGDHEDLGLGLCGNVPRVKSMRKWWHGPGRPAGEPDAPDIQNLTRNDTVQFVGGADPGFIGEQDTTPQPVLINYRLARSWLRPSRWVRYPHPVLCGPRGAITVFPDHPHEGDCIVPAVLNAAEYPGGVAPEVIARGRNVVGRNKNGFVIVDPREFGLLGAYDGHKPAANVGRVLVDATWHHWFNVNLRGLDNTPHTLNYRDILCYYRNVATWLAPVALQRRMRLTGTVISLFSELMVERTLTIRDLRPELFYYFGIEARDALGRIAPQCQSNAWILETIELLRPNFRKAFELTSTKESHPDPWEAFVLDRVAMTTLGGAIASLALEARKADDMTLDKLIEAADTVAAKGLRLGLKQAERELELAGKRLVQATSAVLRTGDAEVTLAE